MYRKGYQQKDLFWTSWQVAQYSNNVFYMVYDLLLAVP